MSIKLTADPTQSPGTQRVMCLTCGATREVSSRFAMTYDRPLRCAACARSTRHGAVEAVGPQGDWRESLNAKEQAEAAKKSAEVRKLEQREEFMLRMFNQLGVRISTAPSIVESGKPCFYTLDRYEFEQGDTVWELLLLDQLTLAGRVWCLCGAWRSLDAEGVARWADEDAYQPRGEARWSGAFRSIGTTDTDMEGRRLLRNGTR